MTGGHYDTKTDMYSLGIILFEVFCKFSTYQEKAKYISLLKYGEELPKDFIKKKALPINVVKLSSSLL